MRIGILGAGSWGSALAVAFSSVAQRCVIWSRNQQQVTQINQVHTNIAYLPEGITFATNIVATLELELALQVDLIVIATPLAALRELLQQMLARVDRVPAIIWACKGIEIGSGLLPHQIVEQVLGRDFNHYGALLGPSFAQEVAFRLPTAITLATGNLEFGFFWIEKFKSIPNFRFYLNSDIIGAEIGAALKNVIAIAAGISSGLSLGANANAALLTRSLNEISALIVALGGNAKTVYGLTGMGDLILTCTGDLSRNRSVGLKLAQGMKVEQAIAEIGHVAEGVTTTKAVYELSLALGIDMPITHAVYNVLYNNYDVKDALVTLFNRDFKLE